MRCRKGHLDAAPHRGGPRCGTEGRMPSMTRRSLQRATALTSIAALSSCAQLTGLSSIHDGICDPGSTKECPYTGPAGTKDVGNCKAAVQTCADDGQSW